MTEQNTDTKNKILEVARVLFADQGFEGTSVREIAKAADVNIASVNYHFTNKENLFSEILNASYLACSQEIRSFYEKENPRLEDILIHIFRYFQLKSHDLITFYKMMMSTQHNQKMVCQNPKDEGNFGPPGGMVIAEAIQKEVGNEVSDRDKHWAVSSLFGHVIHVSIMSKCWYHQNHLPYTSTEDIELNIRRLCRVVLIDLRR